MDEFIKVNFEDIEQISMRLDSAKSIIGTFSNCNSFDLETQKSFNGIEFLLEYIEKDLDKLLKSNK